jgi:hypothetical protein
VQGIIVGFNFCGFFLALGISVMFNSLPSQLGSAVEQPATAVSAVPAA